MKIKRTTKKKRKEVDSLKGNHKEFIKNNKLILKTQQRFRSEKHNVYTKEIKKISLSLNDVKRIQLINWIEAYTQNK